MNPDGQIYRAPEHEIPAEDKARLEGYLLARAEADDLEAIQAKVAALQAREERRERGH
jgi:hypothetical protein